jgi:rhodanese-related sulfurtransferase
MQNFIDFLIRHWELSGAFVVVLIYWIYTEILETREGKGINPVTLVHLLNRQKAILIDIRETAEFEKGHILGALSFPEKTLMADLNKLKKHQSNPVVLIDRQGMTVQKCLNKLTREGFKEIHYLKNGMQAWVQAKLPLEKGKNHAKN